MDRNQRSSAISIGLPWRGLYPKPDTTIAKFDRLQIANLYALDPSRVVTSTSYMQLPVNCVLAGDQDDEDGKKKSPLFKPGRAHHGAMRGIFRE